MLATKVLKSISDTATIAEIIAQSHPAADLVKAYRDVAENEDEAPALPDDATGAQLKEYIEKLDSGYQVDLLAVYRNRIRPKQVMEDPEVVEKRKLKMFMMKGGFIFVCGLILIVTGSVLTLGYKQGVMPDSSVITGLIDTAGEILKFIFSA